MAVGGNFRRGFARENRLGGPRRYIRGRNEIETDLAVCFEIHRLVLVGSYVAASTFRREGNMISFGRGSLRKKVGVLVAILGVLGGVVGPADAESGISASPSPANASADLSATRKAASGTATSTGLPGEKGLAILERSGAPWVSVSLPSGGESSPGAAGRSLSPAIATTAGCSRLNVGFTFAGENVPVPGLYGSDESSFGIVGPTPSESPAPENSFRLSGSPLADVVVGRVTG